MNRNARNWEHCLELASLSDIGMRRANNQDSKAVVLATSPDTWRQRGHLFMVADGMGAHAAGELASKLATDVVPLNYQKLNGLAPPEALRQAIQDANLQIYARGSASEDFRGMGTTASVLALLPQGALVAHVGDSRAYRLRRSRLEQLTFDHSLAWEIREAGRLAARQVPDFIPKNVITRSLGPNPAVRVDLEGPFPLEVGDVFLLCSDGLSGQVDDEEIGKILGCLSPEEAVQALVDLANARGGPDNITVIVARVTGPELTDRDCEVRSPSSVGARSAGPAAWLLSGVLGAAALGLGAGAMALGGIWLSILAAVCAAGAVGFGLSRSIRANGQPATSHPLDTRPLGNAPYAACDCALDAPFVGRLADIAADLRQIAEHEEQPIDWAPFETLVDQAMAAAKANDHAAAVRHSCRAIRHALAHGNHQRQRP